MQDKDDIDCLKMRPKFAAAHFKLKKFPKHVKTSTVDGAEESTLVNGSAYAEVAKVPYQRRTCMYQA